jgi:glycosyltransferase involved in cell wall biosynthesis
MQKNSKILFIFTQSYPFDYAAERTFIEPELDYLVKYFDQIIIFPLCTKGIQYKYLSQIHIETLISDKIKKSNKLVWIFNINFFKDIIKKPWVLFKKQKLKESIAFFGAADIIKKILVNYIKTSRIDIINLLCYSFWNDHSTYGLSLIKKHYFPNLKIISRAHGFDLYEERRDGYIPAIKETLKWLDRLYLACEYSKKYIEEKYPAYKEKFYVSQIGIKDHEIITCSSNDGSIRIVSCSAINNIKRVDLIFSGLKVFALENKDINIEWHHLGDGEERNNLEEKIKQKPNNLKIFIHGNLTNDEVFLFYQKNKLDIFITTSSSEGGSPISLKEALSCGIPIIGTNVGGISEIVNSKTGFLLSKDPAPQEICHAISSLLSDKEKYQTIRNNCRKLFKEQFDSSIVSKKFAQDLREICLN